MTVCHDCHRDIHLDHVEHAAKGLAWATDHLLRQRRLDFGRPPVIFPREARANAKRDRQAQFAIDSPVRMAIRAAVKCPNCRAKPGEFCTTTTFRPRAQNHISRMNAFQRAYPGQAGVLTEAAIERGRRRAVAGRGSNWRRGACPGRHRKAGKPCRPRKGRPMRLRQFELTPDVLEAQEAASRDRTVAGMRAYDHAIAGLDAWGQRWRELVRDALASGFSVEDIAPATGSAVDDVVAVLGTDDEEGGQ